MMYFVLNMIDYLVSHSLTDFFFIFVSESRVDLAPQLSGEAHNELHGLSETISGIVQDSHNLVWDPL